MRISVGVLIVSIIHICACDLSSGETDDTWAENSEPASNKAEFDEPGEADFTDYDLATPQQRRSQIGLGKQDKFTEENFLELEDGAQHRPVKLVDDTVAANNGTGSAQAVNSPQAVKKCPHGGRVPASSYGDGRRRSSDGRRRGSTLHVHFDDISTASRQGSRKSHHDSDRARLEKAANKQKEHWDEHTIHVHFLQGSTHGRRTLSEALLNDREEYVDPYMTEYANRMCRERCQPCGYTIHSAINFGGFNDCDCNSAHSKARVGLVASMVLGVAVLFTLHE